MRTTGAPRLTTTRADSADDASDGPEPAVVISSGYEPVRAVRTGARTPSRDSGPRGRRFKSCLPDSSARHREEFAVTGISASGVRGALCGVLAQEQLNGSWAEGPNEGSVYFTAQSMRAMRALPGRLQAGVATAISTPRTSLLSRADPGGLWGEDFLTALVLLASASSIPDITVLDATASGFPCRSSSRSSTCRASRVRFRPSLALQPDADAPCDDTRGALRILGSGGALPSARCGSDGSRGVRSARQLRPLACRVPHCLRPRGARSIRRRWHEATSPPTRPPATSRRSAPG